MSGSATTAPRRAATPPIERPPIDPYPALLRAALLAAWIPGFGLGIVLIFGVVLQWGMGGWLPLTQAHGHAQLFGFTALFVLGVGSKLFPAFLSTRLANPGRLQFAAVSIGVGVGLRFLLQPLPPDALRGIGLLLGAGLELMGAVLALTALRLTCRASVQPQAPWQLAGMLSFASLLVGYLVNVAASVELARGAAIVPPALDEALVHLGLYGFAALIPLAVGLKIFPQFLILRPARASAFRRALAGYGIGTALVVLGWLAQHWWPDLVEPARWVRLAGWLAAAAGLAAYLVALRLFEPAARPSGTPHITNPTRLWFRLAAAWLLASVVMGVLFAAREALLGSPASFLEASAQRHALAMGFLLLLLVGMAGRILPHFSGEMTRRPVLLASMVWLLLAGATLRVVGQLFWGYSGPGAVLAPLGASLGFIGFAWFSAVLWPTLGRPLGASPA